VVGAPAEAAGRNFYVDCNAGKDGNNGRSGGSAFKTLGRVNNVELRAGDRVLLKRGCTWSGGQRLDLVESGTAGNPIVVGTYGSGARPRIHNGKNQGVKVTGSHILIKKIHVTFGVSATRTVNGCAQPFGSYYGVNFTGGAHHVTLQDSLIEHANAGVHVSANSHHITVQRNKLHNNDVMNVFGGNPNKDLGAWGILVRSDDNEIAHNEFKNNRAPCANGAGRIHSNSVEIFEGQRNYIHHNKSYGDRVFSELGGSSAQKAADNVFEFNLHHSNMVDARFITTRGGGTQWGPVWRTVAEHNTVHLTGNGSVAVSCGEGCSANILTLRGNILTGVDKALYADAAFDEADNVYWNPRGSTTRIQHASTNKRHAPSTAVLNGSIVADPHLARVTNNNFRPQSWSRPSTWPTPLRQPPASTSGAGRGCSTARVTPAPMRWADTHPIANDRAGSTTQGQGGQTGEEPSGHDPGGHEPAGHE
ncbi:MAG: hypothetical protein AAGK32_09305, partial [Actinomycetota bacterium]